MKQSVRTRCAEAIVHNFITITGFAIDTQGMGSQ